MIVGDESGRARPGQRASTRHVLAIGVAACALVMLASPSARANGAYTHIRMSQIAESELPPGPLKDLMSDPAIRPWYEAGSMFPDSGYAAQDGYGELGHWPPFQNAYIQHIIETYGENLDSELARQHIAFLLGAMAHGLEDQIYDSTLRARGFEVDGDPTKDSDRLTDYFTVIDAGVLLSTKAMAHYEEIAAIFLAGDNYQVSVDTLKYGMSLMQAVILAQKSIAKAYYLDAWNNYPWIGTHYFDPAAPGSVPHLGALAAKLWQVVWKRLHQTATIDDDLVIGTIPVDGSENVPIDATESEAYRRIGIVFGFAVTRSQAAPFLKILDPDGNSVPLNVRSPYNGEIRNFLMLQPKQALAYDTLYTVVIEAGVESLSGLVTTTPHSFQFRTRCAPDKLDDCPPLPAPLVTGPIPTSVPGTDASDVGDVDDALQGDDGGETDDADVGLDAGFHDATELDGAPRDGDEDQPASDLATTLDASAVDDLASGSDGLESDRSPGTSSDLDPTDGVTSGEIEGKITGGAGCATSPAPTSGEMSLLFAIVLLFAAGVRRRARPHA
ncbi:MAG: Ig-like domain-containing protein [Myxococcales bacterium]|nr:Ig-like domain-containing protein [Myxococcales bacterium]